MEVKPKMIMTFVASLWATSKTMKDKSKQSSAAGAATEDA